MPGEQGVTETSDWELLEGSTAEDAGGFAVLVERHHAPAVAFCEQVLGDHQLAEDVVQKGFVNIFNARERFERRARFKALLYRVLLNLCLNELERKVPAAHLGSMGSEEGKGVEALVRDEQSRPPDHEILNRELANMLHRAILKLPPKHRAALYLREYVQMSYADIASVLGANLGEVKIWIHRGRAAVQSLIQPYLDKGEAVR